MSKLLIKNGIIYDPINRLVGETKDIAIENGRIVESVKGRDVEVIDASGKIVMPGGVDIHSHIAGSKVNLGRLFRPEDSKVVYPKFHSSRSGSGFSVPSTFATGYLYAKMGWTTVFEPAMPPLKARHTHEEFVDTPIIDKGAFTLLGNNWIVMEYLKRGEIEKCAAYVAWMLKATKGYAVKLVNPGGVEAWGWGMNVGSLSDKVPHFDLTAGEIIEGLARVNELLGLPHSIHTHASNLGVPGNYTTTLETFDVTREIKPNEEVGRKNVIHAAHVQFHSYGGEDWRTFESRADEIAKHVNKHEHLVIDVGQVTLDETTTMTADGPFQFHLHELNRLKWTNADVELETGAGIVPFIYSSRSLVNSVQWAIGLELFLLIKDPRKVLLSTDHPNAGPFIRYPRIIAWLMSKRARREQLDKAHKNIERTSTIATIDREFGFEDIAWITRAGAALALGLKDKGHLGPGAVADIAIYGFNPKKMDPSRKFGEVERAFSEADFCIKDGVVVVRDGKVVKEVVGRTHIVDAKVPKEIEDEVMLEITDKFKQFYTINISNYPVQPGYVPRPEVVNVNAIPFFRGSG
jgi:formylmethanofuran dehydrogenase subunit A